MPYRELYIFVEGPDDSSFIEKIIKPKLGNSYQNINIQEYQSQKGKDKEYFIKLIKNLKRRSQDYFFFADINDDPCISQKKSRVFQKYHDILDMHRIIIVKKEIESWYKAGLDINHCQQLKIKYHTDTNNLTKEEFSRTIPRKFDRYTFMLELLNCFSIEAAINSNSSFRYFITRYCSPASLN
jgi:hypothetical protein